MILVSMIRSIITLIKSRSQQQVSYPWSEAAADSTMLCCVQGGCETDAIPVSFRGSPTGQAALCTSQAGEPASAPEADGTPLVPNPPTSQGAVSPGPSTPERSSEASEDFSDDQAGQGLSLSGADQKPDTGHEMQQEKPACPPAFEGCKGPVSGEEGPATNHDAGDMHRSEKDQETPEVSLGLESLLAPESDVEEEADLSPAAEYPDSCPLLATPYDESYAESEESGEQYCR
jgi:hypothetical protein